MFKTTCPKCKEDTDVVNGQCKKCGYMISDYMKSIGLFEGNRIIANKVYVCPKCGTIDAGQQQIRLKCYECETPYKATDIDREEWSCLIGEEEREFFNKYVGDTIDWKIYNDREEEFRNRCRESANRTRNKITIKCPKCKSMFITSYKRIDLISMTIDNGRKIYNCLSCGYKWKM